MKDQDIEVVVNGDRLLSAVQWLTILKSPTGNLSHLNHRTMDKCISRCYKQFNCEHCPKKVSDIDVYLDTFNFILLLGVFVIGVVLKGVTI